ncbi:oxidoreductase [Methylobacterium oryzisoli]|uniref:oxidoreductase n=1 Tax=Methylobacterium oryzisoli TaxID=3385502 RepID=UPI003891A3DE
MSREQAGIRRNWLITGVSSGIGRSLAEAALGQGDVVVGTVRKPGQIAEIERLAPGRAMAVLLDVTDPGSVAAGVEAAAKALGGRIDVLVNNAGWGLVGAVEETSDAEAHAVFEANFFGQLAVTRAVLPFMRAQGSGHILAASAIGGFTGFPGLSVYSAAKAAVDVMNEALASEVASFGIKVTVLTLGIFRTNFAASSLKETSAMDIYADTPAGRFRGFIGGLTGKQPNDPVRGAQAILQVVASANPPLHLVLGPDALGVVRKKLDGVRGDVAAWQAVSASTAFPDVA